MTSFGIFRNIFYSDIPEVGASIIVVATDQASGDRAARALAEAFWQQRERFIVDLPGVIQGVSLALSLQEDKPVVLADISDNPLSGGSGDTTALLKELIDHSLTDALFGGLYDPESLSRCVEAGEGATVTLQLGGKCSPEFGKPIQAEATVVKLSDGRFTNKGPMNTGLLVDMKGAAHIRVGELDILLTGRALSANDPEMFRHIGIEPTAKRILGLKVKNHFRAAFDPLVSQIIYIDGPGVASNQLTSFSYTRIPRPIWPLDQIEAWDRQGGEREG